MQSVPVYNPTQHHWALRPGDQHRVKTVPSYPSPGNRDKEQDIRENHSFHSGFASREICSFQLHLSAESVTPPAMYNILFYKCKAISIECRDTEAQRRKRIISYLPLIPTIPKDPGAVCFTFYMYAQLISITTELQVFSDLVEGISCSRRVSKLFLLFLLQPTLIIQGNGITGTKQKHG